MDPSNQSFQPGVAAVPATQVEISVACRNIRDKDVFSKSDPMCVLFMQSPRGSFYEVGRTEVIKDSLNPDFVTKFVVQYRFEESQKMKFEVYDVDCRSQRLDLQDFLGRAECTLGEIVASQGNQFKKNLMSSSSAQYTSYGEIILIADEVTACKEVVTMQFFAKNLDKKDFFGKSDPFLVFFRANEDGSFTVVHKTEVIKNTLNPTWKPFTISARALCNGDHHRTIKVECYDWDSDGGHDLIGVFSTNLKTLTEGPGAQNEYECINAKKKAKKKSYTNSGVVKLSSIRIEEEQTFLDYIKGGTQMNFTVAVDFTASNGDPRDSRSLHYMYSSQPNAYRLAIQAVGEIIQDYDSDKLFPALGFGAKLPPDGRVSHEFFLNGHPSNPYCEGVEGVLNAYGRTLSTVQLYGPTNFSPVINHVTKFATAYQDGSNYFVLLIITDGVISDMPATKEAIVRASSLPMSIIIVGVGDADFAAMEELDGDNVRISSHGRYAERDIVQFVAFRNFLNMSDWMTSKVMLAKEVLAEIPTQFLLYMKKRGIKAKPPTGNPGSVPSAFSGLPPAPLHPQNPGAMQPQNPGAMQPQNPGAMQPQNPGAMQPQNPGAMQPQNPGAMQPQNPGAMPPQYPGQLPPQYQGQLPPQYPGYAQQSQYPPGVPPVSASAVPGQPYPYSPSAPAI